jgi:ribosomal protein S18 acetylase RimI-like enzyme
MEKLSEWAMRAAVPDDQKWVAKLFDLNKDILGKVGGGSVFWRALNGGNPREHFWVIPEIAFAHWLVRKDGVCVLYEIAVSAQWKRRGLATRLLSHIRGPGNNIIELKTDAEHAESNAFYGALGFKKMGYKTAKSGKRMAIYQKW